MKRKHPFTVRKMVNGYNGVAKYHVYYKGERCSVHADLHRDVAQAQADRLNIAEMVKPHAEDPRPYEVRYAEAEAAYRAEQAGKPLVEVL
jgi:hypothetical protein